MTEQQIREAYERLDAAIVPPPDAPERVRHAVVSRRRRRRTALAGGAALAVVCGGALIAGLQGGQDDDTTAVDAPGDTLVLTRPDGSTFAFSDYTVTCRTPRADDDSPARGDWIQMGSPIRFVPGSDEERLEQPFVMFEGRVEALTAGREFDLPASGPGSRGNSLTLFVADTEGAEDGNEVVSGEPDSSGTVTVVRASCDPEPVLELELDVTLGSEEGKQPLDLAGTLR